MAHSGLRLSVGAMYGGGPKKISKRAHEIKGCIEIRTMSPAVG